MRKKAARHFFQMLLTVLCIIGIPSRVFADENREPENSYYREHWEEFVREDRVYILTEDQELYNAPGEEVLTVLKSGDAVRISYVQPEKEAKGWLAGLFRDEQRWGLTEVSRGGNWYTGWLCMNTMELLYDGKSFFEEYEAEIQPYAAQIDTEVSREAAVWEYPYSGQYKGRISGIPANAKLSYLYTGEDGLRWGYTDYGGGIRGWICLDNPGGDGLPTADMQKSEKTPENGRILQDILIGISAVCAAFGIFIIKKNGRKLSLKFRQMKSIIKPERGKEEQDMAVIDGCEAQKRTPVPKEIKCPKCGEMMEVFTKEDRSIEDVKCEKCGYEVHEGDPV